MNRVINEGAYKKVSLLTDRMYFYLKKIQSKYGSEKWVKRDILRQLAESKDYKYKSVNKSLNELENYFVNIAFIYDRKKGGGLYRFIDFTDLVGRTKIFRLFDSL